MKKIVGVFSTDYKCSEINIVTCFKSKFAFVKLSNWAIIE